MAQVPFKAYLHLTNRDLSQLHLILSLSLAHKHDRGGNGGGQSSEHGKSARQWRGRFAGEAPGWSTEVHAFTLLPPEISRFPTHILILHEVHCLIFYLAWGAVVAWSSGRRRRWPAAGSRRSSLVRRPAVARSRRSFSLPSWRRWPQPMHILSDFLPSIWSLRDGNFIYCDWSIRSDGFTWCSFL
jgi:hypothetical protein